MRSSDLWHFKHDLHVSRTDNKKCCICAVYRTIICNLNRRKRRIQPLFITASHRKSTASKRGLKFSNWADSFTAERRIKPRPRKADFLSLPVYCEPTLAVYTSNDRFANPSGRVLRKQAVVVLLLCTASTIWAVTGRHVTGDPPSLP